MVTVNEDTVVHNNPLILSLIKSSDLTKNVNELSGLSTGTAVSVEAFLNFENIPGYFESKSFLEPMPAGRDQIITVINMLLWRDKKIDPYENHLVSEEIETKLERVVLSEFAAISEVIKIYVEKYLSEFIFSVFIGKNSYDDQFMDVLLSKELEVLDRFPTIPLTFHYLPFETEIKTNQFISGEAKLIFHV